MDSNPPDQLFARKGDVGLGHGVSNGPIYDCVASTVLASGVTGDLLDFGAGRGTLTRRLQESGRFASVSGVDLYPRSAEVPESICWERADLNGSTPFPAGSFDLVVASEVIEHLENPRAMCRELWRILKTGGLAIISTPNVETLRSWVSAVLRGYFVEFSPGNYPAHITPLMRIDLERALQECGFAVEAVSYSRRGGLPGFPGVSWQQISFGLLHGRLFSDTIVLKARRLQPVS